MATADGLQGCEREGIGQFPALEDPRGGQGPPSQMSDFEGLGWIHPFSLDSLGNNERMQSGLSLPPTAELQSHRSLVYSAWPSTAPLAEFVASLLLSLHLFSASTIPVCISPDRRYPGIALPLSTLLRREELSQLPSSLSAQG